MHLFYQNKGGDEAWKPIEDTKDNRELLVRRSAAFVSVLSISDPKCTDLDKIKYKGDLYFDIDSHDISESIETLKALVDKLQSLGVQHMNIFCSGKKGFHLIVPSKVFSKGGQVSYLPYIYGKMAERLEVSGLDFAVYSGGKGRLWRQENVLRPEIFTYKTHITIKQAKTITPEKYKVYVSSPRPVPELPKEFEKSLELTDLYESCKITVVEEQKELSKFEFKPIPELAELKEVPKCITKLATEGDQKSGANFNKAAMQLAGYIKSAGHDKDTIKGLVNLMAKSVKSGTYNSYKKKQSHIWSQIKRAKYDPRMGFSASYLFSTIEPCGGCILCDGSLDKYDQNKRQAESEPVDNNPIFESDGQYWIRYGKIDRPISSFTLQVTAFSQVVDPLTNIPERESSKVKLVYDHLGSAKSYLRDVPEKAWHSVSAFKSALAGIDNVTFLGGETDLANLKHYVFSKDFEMGRVTRVPSAGIYEYKDPLTKRSLLVYTEPDGSLNTFGERDTHELSHKIESAPKLFDSAPLNPDDPDMVLVAKRLCGINSKLNVALILGWYVAAHFKPHIMACEKQFPLLALWGNAGSGKSKTASIFAYLHGCDFEGVDDIVSCEGSTPWSLAEYMGSSTSTPRLLDECNKPKLGKIYGTITGYLKSAFINGAATKGKLKGRGDGAEISSRRLSGAIVYMAEQLPSDEPALIQRSITAKLSRKSREGCKEDWEYVYDNKDLITSIGQAIMISALKVPKKTIAHWMNYFKDFIPPEREIDSRPHFSFRAVLTGLKMYEIVLSNYDIDVSEEVAGLIETLITELKVSQIAVSQAKNRSVVDDVIDTMAQMATEQEKDATIRNGMVKDVAYSRDEDYLYIDANSVWGRYKMYVRSTNGQVVLPDYRGFLELLVDEPYFVGLERFEDLTSARDCICLDVQKLRDKGVSVELFELT